MPTLLPHAVLWRAFGQEVVTSKGLSLVSPLLLQ